MKRGKKDYVGERKATRDKGENERLREKIKVQIVPWVKIKIMGGRGGRRKCERGESKGFRERVGRI